MLVRQGREGLGRDLGRMLMYQFGLQRISYRVRDTEGAAALARTDPCQCWDTGGQGRCAGDRPVSWTSVSIPCCLSCMDRPWIQNLDDLAW